MPKLADQFRLPREGDESDRAPIAISDRRLAGNMLWNLVGEAAPFAIALFAIPMLVRALGLTRFGILTMLWSVLNYFGIFDLGLGRAITKLVAEELGQGKTRDIPALFWTGMLLMAGAGLAGAIAAAGGLFLLRGHALGLSSELRRETFGAGYLLALGFPIIVSSAGLRGMLAALQRFDLINLIEMPAGALLFLAPLAVLPMSHSLIAIACALLAVRLASWLGALYMCRCAAPEALSFVFERRFVRPLTSFGGWVMVSNIVGPLMIFSDRFAIALLLSVGEVAFYTTPFEMLFRISIIPSAITAVLFPALTESIHRQPHRTVALFDQGSKLIIYIVFPFLLVAAVFARKGLQIWLGAAFASRSVVIVEWLAIALLINAAAWVAFALIQATHRPDLTAKLHLIELPLYLLLLWRLLSRFGIVGAAMAWTARALVDALALLWTAAHLEPAIRRTARGILLLVLAAVGALSVIALLPDKWMLRGAYVVLCLALTAIAAMPELGWLY